MLDELSSSYIQKTKRSYLFAFGSILILLISAQIYIQTFISNQSENSNVVNIAGRQRMLSQRLARFINEIKVNPSNQVVYELTKAVHSLEKNHYFLMKSENNISSFFENHIKQHYVNLSPSVNSIVSDSKCVIEMCKDHKKRGQKVILEIDEYLNKMNEIVFMTSGYAKKEMRLLSIIEIIIFVAISVVMFIQFFLVLIPVHRKISLNLVNEKEEKQRRERLYHLAELGEMSSEITHEINNFLTTIELSNKMLNREIEKNSEFKNMLPFTEKIESGIVKISNICRGVSKLSRVSDVNSFKLTLLVEDIEQIFSDKMRKHKIEFRINYKEEMDITSNQTQISQVLFNLIKNSIQALEPIEIGRRIDMDIFSRKDMIFFRVEDNGMGIKPDIRSKVLNAFFTTKEPGKGTGLGLSLSKKIATALGGDLELLDNAETTVFLFSIKNSDFSIDSKKRPVA